MQTDPRPLRGTSPCEPVRAWGLFPLRFVRISTRTSSVGQKFRIAYCSHCALPASHKLVFKCYVSHDPLLSSELLHAWFPLLRVVCVPMSAMHCLTPRCVSCLFLCRFCHSTRPFSRAFRSHNFSTYSLPTMFFTFRFPPSFLFCAHAHPPSPSILETENTVALGVVRAMQPCPDPASKNTIALRASSSPPHSPQQRSQHVATLSYQQPPPPQQRLAQQADRHHQGPQQVPIVSEAVKPSPAGLASSSVIHVVPPLPRTKQAATNTTAITDASLAALRSAVAPTSTTVATTTTLVAGAAPMLSAYPSTGSSPPLLNKDSRAVAGVAAADTATGPTAPPATELTAKQPAAPTPSHSPLLASTPSQLSTLASITRSSSGSLPTAYPVMEATAPLLATTAMRTRCYAAPVLRRCAYRTMRALAEPPLTADGSSEALAVEDLQKSLGAGLLPPVGGPSCGHSPSDVEAEVGGGGEKWVSAGRNWLSAAGFGDRGNRMALTRVGGACSPAHISHLVSALLFFSAHAGGLVVYASALPPTPPSLVGGPLLAASLPSRLHPSVFAPSSPAAATAATWAPAPPLQSPLMIVRSPPAPGVGAALAPEAWDVSRTALRTPQSAPPAQPQPDPLLATSPLTLRQHRGMAADGATETPGVMIPTTSASFRHVTSASLVTPATDAPGTSLGLLPRNQGSGAGCWASPPQVPFSSATVARSPKFRPATGAVATASPWRSPWGASSPTGTTRSRSLSPGGGRSPGKCRDRAFAVARGVSGDPRPTLPVEVGKRLCCLLPFLSLLSMLVCVCPWLVLFLLLWPGIRTHARWPPSLTMRSTICARASTAAAWPYPSNA